MATPASRPWAWEVVQGIAILATAALVVGLIVSPATSLTILWDVLIPAVPASLLLSPAIWRNVCPLASLNRLGGRPGTGRILERRVADRLWIVGIVLLLVLVPARRFLFNTNGPALAVTVAVVGLAAFFLGRVFDMKAGFCNSMCPVLPVERLYGQAPLLKIGNPRCPQCTTCTPAGCLDLAPTKTVAQLLGSSRRSPRWLGSSFGLFAAGFPGFIVGYNTLGDTDWTSALAVYGHVLAWVAGSYLVAVAVIAGFGVGSTKATQALAGIAAGLYYWFAPTSIGQALGLGQPFVTLLRVLFLTLVVYWWWRAVTVRPHELTALKGSS